MNKLDKDFQGILRYACENGHVKLDRTGTGTISVFGSGLRHKMSTGFPLLTTKRMYIHGIIEELLWFLRGNTNIRELLVKNVNIWNGDAYKKYVTGIAQFLPDTPILSMDEFVVKVLNDDMFASVWGDLGRVYGKQWREWGTSFKYVDQIEVLIDQLINNPDSRRLMVSAWKVDELDTMTLPPCHYHFQCYTRELSFEERIAYCNKNYDILLAGYPEELYQLDKVFNVPKRELSLQWNQRSVDTFLGLPFNIASYGFLIHILCKIVNMVPGELIGAFGDTHIYSNHADAVETLLKREPKILPTLELTGEFNNIQSYWVGGKFDLDKFLNKLSSGDFSILNYDPHPTIKAPLSN